MSLEVIILAAGQGTRMRSALPKVLHPLAGKPMLQHAIDAAAQTDPAAIHVVVGHGAEQVKAGVSHPNLQWALQAEQKGTGHAVAQGLAAVAEDATVLITYGDVRTIFMLKKMLSGGMCIPQFAGHLPQWALAGACSAGSAHQ